MAVSATQKVLQGSLALITGAGSGIGRAACRLLAREGAVVVAVDVNESGLTETCAKLKDGDHKHFVVDVGDSQSVGDLLHSVQSHYKTAPVILVNSAGIIRDTFMVGMTEEDFDEVIRVNLKGTYLMTKATTDAMIKHQVQPASIVNISSIVGKVGNMGQINYAASKAGVIGLTKSVARELAVYGIRCNAIQPGFIETAMTRNVPDKLMQVLLKTIPMKRQGYPEEVAEAVLFLASQRSSYITGNTIEVAGGIHM